MGSYVMLYFMDERFQREVQDFVAVQLVMKWQWIDSETYFNFFFKLLQSWSRIHINLKMKNATVMAETVGNICLMVYLLFFTRIPAGLNLQ
jgi:hypothetical protein